MNSSQILQAIDAIAAVASKNEKIAMVTAGAKDENFKRVLQYTYDPFKTYGVRQIPERDPVGSDDNFDATTWTILDGMIARRLSGNEARLAMNAEINRLNELSADLFVRIIRKDLRAGFSESTCNKAVKGLIPAFPYMRCSLAKDAKFDEWDWKKGAISQEKADGMFANVNYELGGLVSICSRQGSPFPLTAFGGLVKEVQATLAPNHQYHGEILVKRESEVLPREIGNGILNSVLSGGEFGENEEPVFMMWDMIPFASVVPKGRFEMPYFSRLKSIIEQLTENPRSAIRLIDTRICHSLDEAYEHYREMLTQGKEGTIIKNPNGVWRDGTSRDQIKLKLEADVDLKVVGIVPGKAGSRNEGRAGSLTCVTSCGKLRVDVTVKNEAMRDLIDANPEDCLDNILVVRANSVMRPSASNDSYSLFLPRMVEAGFRTDKSEPDSLERVLEQFDAAVKAA